MKIAKLVVLGASIGLSPLCHAQAEPGPNPLAGIESAVGGFFSSITGAIAGALDPKASELREHIGRGDFVAAEAFYRGNADYFADPRYEPLLREIAQGINDRRRPDLESALAQIRALPRPVAAEGQEAAKESVARAEGLIWNLKQTPLVVDRFRSPLLDELEAAAADLRSRLAYEPALAAIRALARPVTPELWGAARQAIGQANAALAAPSSGADAALLELRGLRDLHVKELVEGAGSAFRQYDHARPELFFDAYPVAIAADARPGLIKAQAAAWQAALARSSTEQQERLAAAYAPYLDEAERENFGRAYAQAVIRARGLGEPLGLGNLLTVIRQVEKAGLPAADLQARIHVWIVKGQPGAQAAQLALPAHQAVREIAPEALEAWAASVARDKRPDIHLLVDPYRAHVRNGLADVAGQPRQFVAGERDEPNPAWDSAQRELEAAHDQLRDVEQQERMAQEQMRQLQQQSLGNRSRLGAGLGAGMVAWGANAARERVREAEQAARTTPRMVRKEVIESYSAPVARLELFRTHAVAVYAVEAASGGFGKFELRNSARDTADLIVGLHPADREQSSVQGANASAQGRLVGAAKQPLTVTQEALWAAILERQPAADQPLRVLAKTVLSDRRQWAEEAARDMAAFRQQSAQADARLKSALSQNHAMFRRAASTRYAAVEPEPYARERTAGQNLLDAMRDLNDALIDMAEQQRSGAGTGAFSAATPVPGGPCPDPTQTRLATGQCYGDGRKVEYQPYRQGSGGAQPAYSGPGRVVRGQK